MEFKTIWQLSTAIPGDYEKVKKEFEDGFDKMGIKNPKIKYDAENEVFKLGYSEIELLAMDFNHNMFKVSSMKTIFDGSSKTPWMRSGFSKMGIVASRPKEYWIERNVLNTQADIFFAKDNLIKEKKNLPDNLFDKTPRGAVKMLLEENEGVCLGEVHDSISSKKVLIDNMNLFKKTGVDTLFIEHLMSDIHQEALDTYFNSKSSEDMPIELKTYLDELNVGHMGMVRNSNKEKYNFTEVIKAAKDAGVRVVAIDTEASYTMFKDGINSSEQDKKRYKTMNLLAYQTINKEKNSGKWIAFVGSAHSTTCENVPGISELMGVPSIIVDDKENIDKPVLKIKPKNYAEGKIKPDIVITIDPNEQKKERIVESKISVIENKGNKPSMDKQI